MSYLIEDLQGCDFLMFDFNNKRRIFKNKSEIRNTLLNIGQIDGTFDNLEIDLRKITTNFLLDIWELNLIEIKDKEVLK